MSRAFVNEDAAGSNEAEAPELKIPIPAGSRNYLTPEGADALSRELHSLTAELRPRLQSELAAAGAAGKAADPDQSAALRRRLGEVDRRIAYLDTMAALAEVVPTPQPGSRDRVTFGAWVRVRDQQGAERSYRIVGVDEADPDRGLVGWPSPVARALVGRKVGERSTVRLPGGEISLELLEIDYKSPPSGG